MISESTSGPGGANLILGSAFGFLVFKSGVYFFRGKLFPVLLLGLCFMWIFGGDFFVLEGGGGGVRVQGFGIWDLRLDEAVGS